MNTGNKPGDWTAARPKTLVDYAVESILAAAAQGLILPGDRLSEPDLAKHLDMSRVPIREALRTLESQGVVTSEPYKGIRLMQVTDERLEQIIDVRVAFETLAAARAVEAGRNGREAQGLLKAAIDEMALTADRGDFFGFAQADTDFHRRLVGLAGNLVLLGSWEALARQLTVLFGLSTGSKPMPAMVEEHYALASAFATGDADALSSALDEHICIQTLDVRHAEIVARRCAERG